MQSIYGSKKIRKIHLSVLNIFKTACYFVVSCSQKGVRNMKSVFCRQVS
ncbi:hypothetical protein NEICINOT_04220 [Neisseria cinerea ATCC 14685]|uniref:Uncharacterized protein n=1 Tax=Neisseria cinerea ATCC 14685 TaxID=546262 RepID=D0W3I0_NEICI|nr:hypothetical protein NEICINOT_04220 [Neisseria cinerea ATCC 14685]